MEMADDCIPVFVMSFKLSTTRLYNLAHNSSLSFFSLLTPLLAIVFTMLELVDKLKHMGSLHCASPYGTNTFLNFIPKKWPGLNLTRFTLKRGTLLSDEDNMSMIRAKYRQNGLPKNLHKVASKQEYSKLDRASQK